MRFALLVIALMFAFAGELASAATVKVTWKSAPTLCSGAPVPETGPDSIATHQLWWSRTSRADEGHDTGAPAENCAVGPFPTDYRYPNKVFLDPRTTSTEIELAPGKWFLAMTSTSRGEVESRYSAELAIDVTEGVEPPPIDFTEVNGTGTCDGCVQAGPLLIGETGKEITVNWKAEGLKIWRIVKVGALWGTYSGRTEENSWTFTPKRAGLYYARIKKCGECEWESNHELGYMFYIKLAAPTGGGIE